MAKLPEHDRRNANVSVYTKTEWFKTTYQTFIRLGAGLIIVAIGYLFTMYYQNKANTRQIPIQWEQIGKLRETIHKMDIESRAVHSKNEETIQEMKRQLCDIRDSINTLRELHYR